MNLSHRQSDRKKKLQKCSVKNNRRKRKFIKIKKQSKKGKIKKVCCVKTTEVRRNQKIQRKLMQEQHQIQMLSKDMSRWLLVDEINKIAIETGYIKKINAKILPIFFVLTLACTMYNNGASTYIELASSMGLWFNIRITAQALFGRVSRKESADFLRCIFIHVSAKQMASGFKNKYSEILNKFKAVKIEDSTQFLLHEKVADTFKGSGGSASKSAMKLNTVYDITNNTISHLDIVSGATSDQSLSKNVRKQICKGILWIRDLGYFNMIDMLWIIKKGAYFLSRMKKGVHVFLNENDKTPVNIETFLADNTKDGASFDRDVYIGEGESRIKVRMVGERVPDSVKEKRIDRYKKEKIKRDKKKVMKEDYIVWFGYSIYITNVSREWMPSFEIISAVYKIRWQIELFFKRIKSILQIHIIKGCTVQRVHCFIYAKLISLMMAQTVVSYAASICNEDEELSDYKLMRWMQQHNRLVNACIGISTFEDLFEELISSCYLVCKNKRQKSKSTLQQIKEAFDSGQATPVTLDNAA